MSDLGFVLCLVLSVAGLSISMFSVGWWKCYLHLTTRRSKKEVEDRRKHDTDGQGERQKSAAGATATLSEYMNEQRKTIKETQKAFAVEKETGSHYEIELIFRKKGFVVVIG